MKKTLLATTAIATAAALSVGTAQADVNVSAFSDFLVSFGDTDSGSLSSADRDYDFATNSEVHFKASMTADNGIEFGIHIEMEADSAEDVGDASVAGNGKIDENDVYIKGSFGQIRLGNNDGAADAYGVNASYVGVQLGGISNPTGTVLSALRTGSARSDVNLHNDGGDNAKITYFTPRFSGFQAGISFTPDMGSLEEGLGLGVSYSGEFSGFGIDAGVSYATADTVAGSAGAATPICGPNPGDACTSSGIGSASQAGDGEFDGWMAGLMVSYAGFSIAGGYVDEENDDSLGMEENTIYNVGVGYANGPYSVALAGIWSEEDVTDDELTEYSLSLKYNVAPGLSVFASGLIGETETSAGTNDYNLITVGTKVSF